MSQQRADSNDGLVAFIFIVFLIGGVGWGIWYFWHAELTNILRYVRLYEMKLAALWLDEETYTVVVQHHGQNMTHSLAQWINYLPDAPVASLDAPYPIRVMSKLAIEPLKYPIAVILAVMGLIMMFVGPGTSYRKQMTLDDCIKAQAKAFPVIKPFVSFNPLKLPWRILGSPVPAKLPLFAEALSPEEWIAYNRIPKDENGEFDKDAIRTAMQRQLGPRWKGPMKMPAYCQVLFAAFALKAVRQRDRSDKMLDRLMGCWTPEKGLKLDGKLVAEARKIIKDPKIGGLATEKAKGNAYRTTALLRVLLFARQEGGVLAPAQFLWLRGHDRTLWYPLNNLGRQSFHAEAVGALAHFHAERAADMPIPTPQLDNPVNSLVAYMKLDWALPIPELAKG